MSDNESVPAMSVEELPIAELQLDSQNPRLPAYMQGQPESALLRYLIETHNAIEVARSIARFGYFKSEPLIAIRDNDSYVVVEGNRRLAALKVLDQPSLSIGLSDASAWQALAASSSHRSPVPVAIVGSREEVAPVIGFRHISGIEPWEPFAKARFVAQLLDRGLSVFEVSEIVGERTASINSQYRNLRIVEEAREHGIDTERVEASFGVFTRAMTTANIRNYIGVPAPAQVQIGAVFIGEDKVSETAELFSWLFGDDQNSAVISDSRELQRLGEVLQSEDGVSALRSSRQLGDAELASGGPRQRLISNLTSALSNLTSAAADVAEFGDEPEVKELLEQISARIESLVSRAEE